MKMFILKTFCLASILFIAVLTGMQMASNGIQKTKGNSDFKHTTLLKATDKKGIGPLSHDIQAKKKKLEELYSANLFSSIGKKMSDGLTHASAKFIDDITK